MAYLVPMVLGLLVAASLRVSNPEDMEALFHRTQKLLAAGDLVGARAGYERLLAVREQRLLRPSRVPVQIDEERVNLRDAARYQLANLERRQGKLLREEKELAAPGEQDSLEALAKEHIRTAAAGFTALRGEEGFSLRERAAYLVIDSYYEAQDYGKAAAACETLLVQFPGGEYVAKALYNLGWARYELQDYEGAVEDFERFLAVQPKGIRADRARLQLGIALEEAGRMEEALAEFVRLGDAYNPTAMTEAEKTAVALAGLREGQSRRSIAAKAWVKRGDVLKGLGRYEQADRAYQTVIDGFPREEQLVEMAWVRRGLLAEEREGTEAAIAVYRLAGERSERAGFQARMQAARMSLLFEADRYGEALAAHRLYLDHYAGHGEESGLSEAEAQFRVAECLRFLADEVERGGANVAGQAPGSSLESTGGVAARADSCRRLREEAATEYQAFVGEHGDSYLAPDALLAWGTVELALGDTAAAREVFGQLVQAHAGTELGCHGRLQLARLEDVTADSTFELILSECGDAEVQAAAALELGHRYRVQGRLERARELLARVPTEQSAYGHAQLELAQIGVQEGAYGAALGLLDSLLSSQLAWMEEPAFRAQVQAQAGLIHQRQGAHEQALVYLEGAVPALEGKLRAAARFGMGWSRLQAGEAGAAWQVWTATLEEDAPTGQQRRNLLRALGLCARELGEPERALPLYKALLADPETYADGRLALGQYYLDAGEAEQALAQVAELAVGTGGVADGGEMKAPEEEGAAGQAPGTGTTAPGTWEGVAVAGEVTEGSDEARSVGRAAAREAGASGRAEGIAVTGEMSASTVAQACLLAGKSLYALDRLEEAEEMLRRGMQQGVTGDVAADYAFSLGSVAMARGAHAEAIEQFEVARTTASRRSVQAEALYYAAQSAWAAGDPEAARERFAALAGEYPEHGRAAEAAFTVGEILYNAEEYPAAREAYEWVARLWPESPQGGEALYGAAWCSLELRDEAAMTEGFEALADRYPRHERAAEGLLHVADYLYNAGRHDEAEGWYRQIAGRWSEGRPVREARRLLRALGDQEADSLYVSAMGRFDAGEMEAAIVELGKVVAQYPGTPSAAAARCNIGVAYQRMLDYRKAAEAYRDAAVALEGREGEQQALEFAQQGLEWIRVYAFGEDEG